MTAITTSALAPTSTTVGKESADAGSLRRTHRIALLGATAAWATVALVHPMGDDGTVYEGLRHDVPLWIGIHLLQPVLSIALAAGLWAAVRHLRSPAARLARAAIPVYLVCFAAFDSIVGIATGLTVHHANSSTEAAREGAISTTEYLVWNPIAGNTGVIWAVATAALVGTILGTSMALRRAGAARAVWVPLLAGLLLASHAGPAAAVGALALGLGLQRALRDEPGR